MFPSGKGEKLRFVPAAVVGGGGGGGVGRVIDALTLTICRPPPSPSPTGRRRRSWERRCFGENRKRGEVTTCKCCKSFFSFPFSSIMFGIKKRPSNDLR